MPSKCFWAKRYYDKRVSGIIHRQSGRHFDVENVDLPIRLHLFGDYYAWSAVNNVKRVQTGYTKKILLFNDGFAEYYC